MMERRKQSNVPMQIEEVHKVIEVLSGEVNRLKDTKTELDKDIENHKAKISEYVKNQVLLNELINDIAIKRDIINDVTSEMNEISNKVFLAKQELESINVSIEEKNKLFLEVETLKNNIVILQESMESFEDEFAENKRKAQMELDMVKNKIIDLHSSIKEVVNRVQ